MSPRFDTVTERTVWELVSNRQSLMQLAMQADPSDSDDVLRVLAMSVDFVRRFTAIELEVLDDLALIDRSMLIEDQFAQACTSRHPHVLHALLSGDDFAAEIWALLEPEARPHG